MRIACVLDLSMDAARPRLAPSETTACAVALDLRRRYPGTVVEVVALGGPSAVPLLEDLLRLGADAATLLADPAFEGGDALARGRTLAACLRDGGFDGVLAGSRTADAAAGEVPPILAELLGLPACVDVDRVVEIDAGEVTALVDVDDGRGIATYRVLLPALLAVAHRHAWTLPHLRLRDAGADVADRLRVLDRAALGLAAETVGVAGSAVLPDGPLEAPAARDGRSAPVVVRPDDEGIEQVVTLLARRGLV